MEHHFQFTLSGRKLFPLFIIFYVLFIGSYGLIIAAIFLYTSDNMRLARFAVIVSASAAFMFILYCIFTVLFSKKIIPAASVKDEPFGFDCSLSRFLAINIGGALLSLVTLGVYLPWYLTRITRCYVHSISYKGKRIEFCGKGGELFVILLLTLGIPIAVVAVLSEILLKTFEGKPYNQLITQLITNILLVPYIYKLYKWIVNYRYDGRTIRWDTRFIESVLRILGQFALTLVTLGIYYPAAVLNLYRYFASRTVVYREDRLSGSFGFDGDTSRGFLLIWGQILLTLVTAGIYTPWAICRISQWIYRYSYYRAD